MEMSVSTRLGHFARNWRRARTLHLLPLIWVDLLYIYYLCLRANDALHFLCVTILMTAHANLYLLMTRAPFRARTILPYLGVQSLLMLNISFFIDSWLIALGLAGALTVKTMTLLAYAEPGPAPLGAYFLLYASAAGLDVLLAGNERSHLNWQYIVPFLICSGGSALLILRQARAYRNLHAVHDELCTTHTVLAGKHACLTASLVEAEETVLAGERQRIARELHDTLTQDLVGLVWQLEAIDARLAEQQFHRAQEIVQLARQRTRTALSQTRQTIYDLRTDESVQHPLTRRAQAEILRFYQATGVQCHCDLHLLTTIPAWQGEQLLQVIKEGLTNIARHAHAQTAWIKLRTDGAAFVLEIGDDGQGFDSTVRLAGHYGLPGLRERAEYLGGELQIETLPGEGTRLRISLPRSLRAQEAYSL